MYYHGPLREGGVGDMRSLRRDGTDFLWLQRHGSLLSTLLFYQQRCRPQHYVFSMPVCDAQSPVSLPLTIRQQHPFMGYTPSLNYS